MLQLPLQLIQELKRVYGPQLVYLQIANALGNLIIHRLEQLDLSGSRSARRQLFGDGVFGSLMQRQNLSRALNDGHWQSGQPRHFDSIAAIGSPWLDFPKKDDLIARLLH